MEAEFWDILDGLKLIVDRRGERVFIQTNSFEAVIAIHDDSTGTFNSTLIKKIKQTLSMIKQ